MSSTVNKIKETLHISGGNRDLSKNESRTSHLGNPDSISQTERPRSHVYDAPVADNNLGAGNYAPELNSSDTTRHSSNLANKLDPRVDSTSSHQYTRTPYDGNSGSNVTETTGNYLHASNEDPHKIDLLNKLDPRVDSNKSDRESCQTRTRASNCGQSVCSTAKDPGIETRSQGFKTSHQQPQNLEGDLDAYGFAKKW